MKATAWRAAIVVAAVYGFFLIFAQFAFVELLRGGGAGLLGEKVVLGAMAAAGIAGGFLAAWRGADSKLLRISLGIAAASSLVSPYLTFLPGAVVVAILTGAALGVATVTLAAMLPAWCGVAWIGLGTGIGYALCNIPPIFTQTPAAQAWIATGFAIVGLAAVPRSAEWNGAKTSRQVFPAWAAVVFFMALVWLDSAAFFIIQHSVDLKNGTWGDGLLWRNAVVHLLVAVVAGIMLAKSRARLVPALAWIFLAVAAWAVNEASTREWSGWLYPAGVSLYSTALVAWPGWFSGAAGMRKAGWQAAWLFAIAGWFGSANGIGMAQTLHQVPPVFIVISGVLVGLVLLLSDPGKWRDMVGAGLVILVASAFRGGRTSTEVASAGERGHQVYLSEGCIHCHSQYVRPGTLDEEIWGPSRGMDVVMKGNPVAIGNRRQGPDLTNVGARRSEAWLKLHFIDPGALSPGTAMPSYAHLFESGKGDDLVRYLRESGEARMGDVAERAGRWVMHEPDGPLPAGAELFSNNCTMCHGFAGLGDGRLSSELARRPANLVAGPFAWTPAGEDLPLRVARVIKFGIPGTDMPGHEVLTDAQIAALRDYVLELRADR